MDIPDTLITLQRTADAERVALADLANDPAAAERQRYVWFMAAAKAQTAVTEWAAAQAKNRYEVEKELRTIVRHPELIEQ